MSRNAVSRPSSETAIPADSWPRCWSANRPKYVRRATSRSGDRTPNKPHISAHHADALETLCAEPSDVVGGAGEDDLAAQCRLRQFDVRNQPGIRFGFAQRLRQAAVRHVVRERQHRGSLPYETDERRLGGEIELSGCGRDEDDVAAPPGAGNEAHVGHETDAADD